MKQEKNDYRTAMSELRESTAPEKMPFLNKIDRFTGELRRQSATLRSRIDELEGTVDAQRGKIDDLARLQHRVTGLQKELADRQKEQTRLTIQVEELRRVAPEWQEIEREKTCFVKVKVKCLRCGLHFIVCTYDPKRHTASTIYCPECGQHHGHYMVWQEVPNEQMIFQLVPGSDELVELNLPSQARQPRHGKRKTG